MPPALKMIKPDTTAVQTLSGAYGTSIMDDEFTRVQLSKEDAYFLL